MFSKKLLWLLFMVSTLAVQAQDTTIVQTFTFASTTRAGLFQFPLDTASWAKIVMQYRMRCKNGLISTGSNTNLGCGEWDYSCNTYITDSSMIDSVKATANNYNISNFSGSTYPYTNSPTYTYTQYQQQSVDYTNVSNEVLSSVGTGTMASSYPLSNATTSGKTQYLWTAAELSAAGLVAGDIHGLELDLSALGGNLDFLRVKMKATPNTTINQIDNASGWQQVYFLNTLFSSAGYNRLKFYQPFNWDGVSNVLVEINYNNYAATPNNIVNSETAGFEAAVASTSDDYYILQDGVDDYADAGDLNELDGANKFTWEAWVNIKNWKNWVNVFDKNGKTLLQTGDVVGALYCIVRNPNNTYGYANGVLPLNTWTHVAMVYDGTQLTNANRVKLYVNGVQVTLTFSGTIPTTTAADANNSTVHIGQLSGIVDDARIWKTPVDGATIADWRYKKLDSTHPNFVDLLAGYEMNEGSGSTLYDMSGNGHDATQTNGGTWYKFNGNDIFKNLVPTPERPNIKFAQGTYTTLITPSTVLDSIQNAANTVKYYTVQNNNLVLTNTFNAWLSGYFDVLDESGAVVDSVFFPADDTLNIVPLNYYNKWPQKLELMSFVTPYGINLDLGPNGKMWEFDVTDFAPILKNKKYVNVQNGGEWQEDLDIRFLFIKGTPPRNVLAMQQIWPVTADGYQQIINNTRFEPRDVTLRSDASAFKIRSAITGHGQEGEFIPRQHFINLNGGANDYQWQVWKSCATNPVYPQGGTWVYDRSGWCPGAPTDMKEFDITQLVTPGQAVNIDYGVTTATGDSRYIVNNQLVQYGGANYTLDASAELLLQPSDNIAFGRRNPTCMNPVVRVRNTGSTPLTTFTIQYGMQGMPPMTQTWTGNLNFLQSADVTLSAHNWSGTAGIFEARVVTPNSQLDQNPNNDLTYTNYIAPDVLPKKFVITLKANNNPFENEYTLKDHNGNVIINNGGFTANQVYDDTVDLAPGCYELLLNDYGDDGLQWWANTAQGAGYFRLKKATGGILKTFGSDFGAEFRYQFTVTEDNAVTNPNLTQPLLEVYPNPATSQLNVKAHFNTPKSGRLQLLDLNGAVIQEQTFNAETMADWNLKVAHLAKGIYMVICRTADSVTTQKVVVE